jgi:imidazolonepropionase-like amidohydrolase
MAFINVMRNRLVSIAALSVLIFANCLAQNSAPADVKAFVGAEILDGSGKSAIKNGVMIVRDGKIAAIGPASKLRPPVGGETINLAGKFVIPGLISTHVHVSDVQGT